MIATVKPPIRDLLRLRQPLYNGHTPLLEFIPATVVQCLISKINYTETV